MGLVGNDIVKASGGIDKVKQETASLGGSVALWFGRLPARTICMAIQDGNRQKTYDARESIRGRLSAIETRIEAVEERLTLIATDNEHWAEWAKKWTTCSRFPPVRFF